MSHLENCDQLALVVDSFADAIVGADLTAPVPTCPEWTVRDLVTHVGSGHRWSAGGGFDSEGGGTRPDYDVGMARSGHG